MKRKSAIRSPDARSETIGLPTCRVEVSRLGRGRPVLVLHGEEGYELSLPFVDDLAKRREVFAPRMPGFGKSPMPEFVRSVDDVSYIWLDLLDRYDLTELDVIGFSVGGWLAAEMATKNGARFRRLILAGALGVKFGGAYNRDIADIYFHSVEEVRAMRFHDTGKDPHSFGMSKREALAVARQREAIARLCWDPYFHNPSLRRRLHRIDVPTLVVWGAQDRMTPLRYGRAYARSIPGARFVSVPRAGHFPHVEQPQRFAGVIDGFLA